MRLSKKIAAVALAAVMSVSLLTACGGTDAPSSSNPGSSSSSSSSSSADSSSSSSGSASDSSSSSSSSGSSSNSSTEDKEETVAYKDSRTARFYQKLGTSYTLGMKLDVTANDESGTADMLTVTNGSRTYQHVTTQSNGSTESQTVLVDMTKQKAWSLIPMENAGQGKLGYCYSATISGSSTEGSVPSEVMPADGLKFKKETKGNYYIETQSYAVPTDEGLAEFVIAYCYEGNSSVPKYVDAKESLGSKESITIRMTFTRIEYKADAKYLDFETILNQYVDITDKMPSTAQAQEPSVAGLTIG